MITPDAPDRSYSTRLRTALIFTGTGTSGAYHAGVLRALHEAGIKIDLVGGRGVGVASALFAAIDGGARLWEATGVWKAASARSLYGWRSPLRYAGLAVIVAAGLLALPLLLLAFAVLVGLAGMLATLLGFENAGTWLTSSYTRWIDAMFAPAAVPTIVPRLVLFALLAAVAILAVTALAAFLRHRGKRRSRGGSFWRLFGSPLTAEPLVTRCVTELWNLIRGAAPIAAPPRPELGRKYVELLTENLGQPGFRELLVTVHDLDARRDLVFALLAAAHKPRFFARTGTEINARHLEGFDLSGAPREHVLDALAAALAVPLATDPHLVAFSPEGAWRGETHRLCDRPEGLARLLEETAHAGAEQVIVVSASPASGKPHEQSGGRADLRGRASEQLAAFEAAALRDALELFAGRFASIYVVRPDHQPLAPLDFGGFYDERSDRLQTLSELVDRGYEDAYRQFIDPIVGAGAETPDMVQRTNGGQPAAVQL